MRERQLRLARKKKPLVEVPQNVKVAELMDICDASFDKINEAITILNPDMHVNENTVLRNFKFVNSVTNLMGLRCKLVQPTKSVSNPVSSEDQDVYRSPPTTDKSKLTERPPVVTIMGHIDHGKTTLLDALRKTNVAEGEAGGITQAIGAFSVNVMNDRTITFLDTPGHAAFSSMRRRGAQLTDIVVLVVAADDGVMEQTVESIKATKQADVPMIVAINKCDKKRADPNRVLKELETYGVVAEKLGGDVQTVEISALKETGLNDLVECITLLSDVLEISADNTANVEGVVLESLKQHGIGSVTSTVIQQGTLCKGQWLVAGTSSARVRGIFDENRKPVLKAYPGFPVNIFGWTNMPHAGDVVVQVKDKAQANQVVKWREAKLKEKKSLDEFDIISKKRREDRRNYQNIKLNVGHKIHRIYALQKAISHSYDKQTDVPEFGIVVKADTDGSLDVLLSVIDSYDSQDQCLLTLVDFSVGEITESDLERAELSQGAVVAFNVQPSEHIKNAAEAKGIEIISNDVIYHLVNTLKEAMATIAIPETKYVTLGEASVQELFNFKVKNQAYVVAGCKVNEGELLTNETFSLIRDGTTLYEGPLMSMRKNKENVTSVRSNEECGLILGNEVSPLPGDMIKCYSVESIKKIMWTPPGF